MTDSSISSKKTANMLGALAMVLTDNMRARVNEALGLTGESVAAVVTLGANPGLMIGQLAQALGLTQSGGVRLVERLENEGLVRREVGQDPRAVPLRLTAKGRRARRLALEVRARVLDDALRCLDERQEAQLAEALETLLYHTPDTMQEGYRCCRMCDEDACVPQGCPVETRCQEMPP